MILFEGDDFIGMAINLASRLCDVAGPGRDPLHRRGGDGGRATSSKWCRSAYRAIPGIVAPIEVWRIPIAERDDGDLPLSFVE